MPETVLIRVRRSITLAEFNPFSFHWVVATGAFPEHTR
jgi:hypothetical protein